MVEYLNMHTFMTHHSLVSVGIIQKSVNFCAWPVISCDHGIKSDPSPYSTNVTYSIIFVAIRYQF